MASFIDDPCPKPKFKVGQVVWAGDKLRKVVDWGGFSSSLFDKKRPSQWMIGYTLDGDKGHGITWWESSLKPLSKREKGG